jgi:pentatricopeptide repeat protein
MQSTDDIYIRSLSCAEGEVLQKSGPEHFDDHGELAGISSVEWPTIRVAAGDMSSSFSSTFELFPSPPTRLRVQQPGDSSLLPHSEETTPEQSFSSPCTSDSPEAPPCTRRETRSRSQSEPSVRTKVLEWNAKIESSFVKGNPEDGVDMVEAMMDSDGSVPHPASSTYSAIISGFCRTGDFESAFSWFSRLLTQPLSPTDPLGPSCIPPRPDRAAWTAILYFLAERDVPFLNRLFPLFLQASDTDGIEILMQDKLLFFKANSRLLRSLQSVDDRRTVLAFLTSIFYKVSRGESDRSICKDLFLRLLHEGLLVESVEILHHQVEMESGGHQGNTSLDESSVLRTFVTSCTDFILHTSDNRPPCIPLAAALSLAKLGEQLSAKTLTSFDSYAASVHFDAFLAARKHSVLDLLPEDWSIVIHAFCHVAQSSDYDLVLQFPSLSKHSSGFDIFLDDLRYITSPDAVISQLDIRHIVETLGDERTELLLSRFDRPTPASSCDSTPTLSDSQVSSTLPNYTPPLPQIPIATYPPATPPSDILVDGRHSRHIDNLIFSNKTRGAMVAFKALQDGVQNGLFPYLVTLGRLINAFGRLQDLSSAQAVYGYARLVLESPSSHKYGHSQDWLDVEEKMMEACARCGDFELANRHRLSILESGCVPSADAYGAMIAKVKDTDDAKRAWELFEEACRLGSVPNTFLYNTIIAKLSRARKAQHVLQLFHEMVQRGLQPNSVTYGAVICACCRVDDGDSASSLFDKMLTIPNFKPRAAPFNTMIQYFVKTRPDRQRALFYYDSLLAAKVHPTSHTYKVCRSRCVIA